MPTESRLPSRRDRPPAARKVFAVLVALAAVLLLAGLASCGGEASQKSTRGTPAPAMTPSTSVPQTTPSDGGEPPPTGGSGLDPRFDTCAQANAAGYGPYYKDADPEYAWYHDRDHDGIDCEPLNGAESATPEPSGGGAGLDPRFDTCAQANAAGYGPYYKDADPEYDWYQDRDHDGIDCEPWHGGGSSTPAPSETPSTSTPTEEPSDSGPSMEPSPREPSEEPSDLVPGDEPSAPAPSEEPSQP